MTAITYSITLREPLLATQPFSGEANSAVSYSFIPGSMVRGALIGAYLHSRQLAEADLLADDTARRCFFEGAVRFLNAYPMEPGAGVRLLPTPRSWFVAKADLDDDTPPIYDFAVQPKPNLEGPKGAPAEFCRPGSASATLLDPRRHITVHNASRDRDEKSAGQSQVFRYEALAAGQVFKGVILADDPADLPQLLPLLQSVTTMGGSQTAGYGLVEIEPALNESWAGEFAAQPAWPDRTVITLLSDALLRPQGRSLTAAVAAALGVPAAVLTAFQETRVVGGFNRKWGLPLPSVLALQAGSVYTLPAGALDEAAQARLVAAGIGERRLDGFGRLAVNWHTRPHIRGQRVDSRPAATAPPLNAASAGLATRMAGQLLRRTLEQQLAQAVLNADSELSDYLPSKAQLSRVRVAARRAMLAGHLTPIRDHVDSLKLAEKQWQPATLAGQPLLEWVKNRCNLSASDFLETFNMVGQLPQIAGHSGELTEALRVEYQARLIDGVMKAAIETIKAREENHDTTVGK